MKHKIPIMALIVVLVTFLATPMLVPESQAMTYQANAGEMQLFFEGSPVVKDVNDPEYNPVRIHAGEEVEVMIRINNISANDWFVILKAVDSANINCMDEPIPLEIEPSPSGHKIVWMTFSTDRFTREGVANLNLELYVNENGLEYTITESLHFVISSSLSTSDSFNKIMGIAPNTLPEPFDGPTASALITLGIWFLIAVLMIIAIIPAILHFPMKGSKAMNKSNIKSAYKMILLAVVIYGLYESLKVGGASEYVIDFSGRVAAILYVLLGSLISWEIFVIAIQHLFSRRGPDVGPGGVDQTLIPLFNMIGKIIIVTIAVAVVFSILGADLMGIIAGAGIAGLALSLGAQSMLSQFFSGITLLTTRPFKEGDYVKIDGSNELKVQKVGIMNTWFKNPWNEEIISMPNDKVAAGDITNMTGENMYYRFNLYLEVTRDADLALVKKLLVDAAMEQPEIIKDGTVFMPFARATDITESGIKIRLAAFVYNYENSWGVEAVLRERALKEFKENGIRMAYKRIDVRTDSNDRIDYDL